MMALSYRQVMVDGTPAGLRGLEEIFEALHATGRAPDEAGLGLVIVAQAGEHNYIPISARDAFAAVLLQEYATYIAQGDQGGSTHKHDYGTWRGYPREQIPWFPTLNLEACNGCGACLRLCSTQALVATEDGKVVVADAFKCVVGCSSCARVCHPKALTFPSRSMLKAYPLRSAR